MPLPEKTWRHFNLKLPFTQLNFLFFGNQEPEVSPATGFAGLKSFWRGIAKIAKISKGSSKQASEESQVRSQKSGGRSQRALPFNFGILAFMAILAIPAGTILILLFLEFALSCL